LIDNLASDWEPEKYTDEYVANLMKVIDAKMKGRKPRLQARETPHGAEVVDLMARLRASLEGKGSAPKKAAKSPARSAARGKKKSAGRKKTGHAA
jgi:DNA end-binding protein Ku